MNSGRDSFDPVVVSAQAVAKADAAVIAALARMSGTFVPPTDFPEDLIELARSAGISAYSKEQIAELESKLAICMEADYGPGSRLVLKLARSLVHSRLLDAAWREVMAARCSKQA